jgi:hypothetical protein
MNNESSKPNFEILVAAVEEFSREGKVSTVRCDACGGLIEVARIGEMGTAISTKCPCGRYNDNMRGL